MQELRGRVAVVTGGASGIGRGMAQAFAAEGMKVVVADVEKPPLDETVAELARKGADAIGVVCDVSDPASVDALRDRALEQFGAVHVLCNNAGVSGSSVAPLWEAPLDEWEWVMGVNVMGIIHGYRSFIPVMIEQKAPGHVVNTASMAGLIHGAGIYGMTKHAVVALSEGLFLQLRTAGHPIGVSVLCPGWVRTNIMESERNRPETPRPAPANPEQAVAVLEILKGFVKKGLDPEDVGRLVARSIREERFYVLTHPHWENMIRNRMQTILDGGAPLPVPPANEPLWMQAPE
jgi:NAD(P)-dependent dehydrogenase (short-subunit alcohol dehydrogenase family)